MAQLFNNDTIGSSYAEQLTKEHAGTNWGSTGFRYSGRAIAEVVDARSYLRTALDYGCGKGTIAQNFPHLAFTQYDPGIPSLSKKPKGRYDLVVCTDVMEHVEPHLVAHVVKELGEYTDKVLFVDIACYLTGKVFADGPYKDRDLHLVVKDPEWWKQLFDREVGLKFLESRVIEKVSKGKIKKRIQMIYERS